MHSLAVRLHEAAEAERLDLAQVPDGFKPSPRWAPPAQAAESKKEVVSKPDPKAAAPAVDLAAPYRAAHRLTGVMRAGLRNPGGLAIINGRTVLPGQVVDGLTLVSVDKHGATLSGPQFQAELKLEGFAKP